MHHRYTYMYINFQQIGFVDQSKPCTQMYLQKSHQLHKFATTISNVQKNMMSDMHHDMTYNRTCRNPVSIPIKTVQSFD